MTSKREQTNSNNLEDIYNLYKRDVYSFFYFRTKNPHISEDLMQEVFLRVCRKIYLVRKPDSLNFWIFKICNNTYKSYYKKHKLELERTVDNDGDFEVIESISDFTESALEFLIKCEDISRLATALEKLSKEEQLLIQLRYVEGKAFKEISFITGINENTLKARLYRSFEKCRRMYLELEDSDERV